MACQKTAVHVSNIEFDHRIFDIKIDLVHIHQKHILRPVLSVISFLKVKYVYAGSISSRCRSSEGTKLVRKGWEHKTWIEVMTAQVAHKVDESL